MKNRDLGQLGEDKAAEYLKAKGYDILQRNYRASHAEVDIVAYYELQIIFVEVKTRSYDYYGPPQEFVTAQKQKNIAFAAGIYCEDKKHEGEIRFDIIGIIFNKGEYHIKHIEDAFFPGLE